MKTLCDDFVYEFEKGKFERPGIKHAIPRTKYFQKIF